MLELIKQNNNVAVLYLDNPPLNLVTLEMTQEFKRVLSDIEADNDIKAVVITGKGDRFFCVGSDIKEFHHVRHNVVDFKLEEENRVFRMIEQLSKPVIAALNGTTLGGGCEIALACDIRVISRGAEIGLPEIKLGVFPGSGGLFRLPQIVGISNAMELMYTGKSINAETAHRIGLVNDVIEPREVLSCAIELAGNIANFSKDALRIIKQGVRKTMEISTDEMMKYNLEMSDFIFKTDDCQEGIDAFFEKRDPIFK